MPEKDLSREVARLRAENEALKSKRAGGLQLKVSQKGAVSVYGLRRFPITFYKEEWFRLLDMGDEIRAFILQNDADLAQRGGR